LKVLKGLEARFCQDHFSVARSVSTVHIWKPASLSASTLGIFKGRAAEKHHHEFLSDEELDT
jgi:hypothetical protein